MGSEAALWNTVRKNMKGKWQADRIESIVSLGVPDVYATLDTSIRTCDGLCRNMVWIELKHVHEWPKRETTIIKIEHYTSQQKNWIKRHGELDGNVYLLLQVERDYMLYAWEPALKVGQLTKAELIETAYQYWKGRINYNEFLNAL